MYGLLKKGSLQLIYYQAVAKEVGCCHNLG